MIDGGSSFVALWRVLVPISLPGIVSVGIYTFMLAWNEFLFALTLTKTIDMRTVPVGIQIADGPTFLRMESDDGDECAWVSACLATVPVLPTILYCRDDGRLRQRLKQFRTSQLKFSLIDHHTITQLDTLEKLEILLC